MVVTSRFPDLDIPQTDVASYLFSQSAARQDEPIWLDAESPSKNVTPARLKALVSRLGLGMQRKSIMPGDVCLICSPNHIMVPVAYLGIIAYGAIFSGVNPAYTVDGEFAPPLSLSTAQWHDSVLNVEYQRWSFNCGTRHRG